MRPQVAPATSRRIADLVEASGASYVDAGLVGAGRKGPLESRIYLAGQAAPRLASIFGQGRIEAVRGQGGAEQSESTASLQEREKARPSPSLTT